MSVLSKFLSRNTVPRGGTLPLVHTTRAYHLREIASTGKIVAQPCDVYRGEKLTYFFMGRPAYKFGDADDEAAYWELPLCFIFAFDAISPKKRVFPFDTGAHAAGLYPNYLNMMKRDRFDAASISDAPSRIVGAFFGNTQSYFDLQPKSSQEFEKEYGLGPLEAEVRAIHRLALTPSPESFDDRRLAIEIQSDQSVDLNSATPLAVVLPIIYLDDEDVRRVVVEEWKAEPLTYPIYPLSVNLYYGMIYERVASFFRAHGYI
jgi:hypothetical protein